MAVELKVFVMCSVRVQKELLLFGPVAVLDSSYELSII